MSTSSKRASRICCTRKTEVAARIADAGPKRFSHVCPARSIGSKGSPSGRTMRGTLPAERPAGWDRAVIHRRVDTRWPCGLWTRHRRPATRRQPCPGCSSPRCPPSLRGRSSVAPRRPSGRLTRARCAPRPGDALPDVYAGRPGDDARTAPSRPRGAAARRRRCGRSAAALGCPPVDPTATSNSSPPDLAGRLPVVSRESGALPRHDGRHRARRSAVTSSRDRASISSRSRHSTSSRRHRRRLSWPRRHEDLRSQPQPARRPAAVDPPGRRGAADRRSPPETRRRLALAQVPLPRPVAQFVVRADRHRAPGDFAARARVAGRARPLARRTGKLGGPRLLLRARGAMSASTSATARWSTPGNDEADRRRRRRTVDMAGYNFARRIADFSSALRPDRDGPRTWRPGRPIGGHGATRTGNPARARTESDELVPHDRGLHALGDHVHVQGVGEVDRRLHDRGGARIGVQLRRRRSGRA